MFVDHRRDRRDNQQEEEPEWFSSGPVSQSDTIELHGFERERRDSEQTGEEQTTAKGKEEVEVEVSDDEEKEGAGEGEPECVISLIGIRTA